MFQIEQGYYDDVSQNDILRAEVLSWCLEKTDWTLSQTTGGFLSEGTVTSIEGNESLLQTVVPFAINYSPVDPMGELRRRLSFGRYLRVSNASIGWAGVQSGSTEDGWYLPGPNPQEPEMLLQVLEGAGGPSAVASAMDSREGFGGYRHRRREIRNVTGQYAFANLGRFSGSGCAVRLYVRMSGSFLQAQLDGSREESEIVPGAPVKTDGRFHYIAEGSPDGVVVLSFAAGKADLPPLIHIPPTPPDGVGLYKSFGVVEAGAIIDVFGGQCVSGLPSNCRICPCDPFRDGRSAGFAGPVLNGGYVPIADHEFRSFSFVNNIARFYRHEAQDWSVVPEESRAMCVSCGQADADDEKTQLPLLEVRRVHAYERGWYPSSLGKGVFLSTDYSLSEVGKRQLVVGYVVNGDGASMPIVESFPVLVFHDPSSSFPVALFPTGGVLEGGRILWKSAAFGGAIDLSVNSGQQMPKSEDIVEATVKAPDGRTVRFECFMRNGRLTSRCAGVTTARGVGLTIEYQLGTDAGDEAFKIKSIVDGHGHRVSFVYEALGVKGVFPRVAALRAPGGVELRYAYDANGYLRQVELPNGDAAAISVIGSLVGISDSAQSGTHRRKSVLLTSLPTEGNPAPPYYVNPGYIESVTNGANELSYRARSIRLFSTETIEVQMGPTVRRFVGDHDRTSGRFLLSGVDHGSSWSWGEYAVNADWKRGAQYLGWDSSFHQTGHIDATGTPVAVTISSSGATQSYKIGELPAETAEYGLFSLPTKHTDRLGRVTLNAYDAQGNLIQRVEAAGTAQAATSSATYNAKGQVLTRTDALNRTTSYGYDEIGYLVSVSKPGDTAEAPALVTRFEHDEIGRRTAVIDPEGRRTVFAYDLRNRLVQTTYADTSTETVTYGSGVDANLVIARTDRNGVATRYGYDLAGRLTSMTTAADTPVAVTETYTYVPGTTELATVTRAGELTTYTYDDRMRRIAVTVTPRSGVSLTERMAYDNKDRLIQRTDAAGRRTFLVYDVLDQVVRTVQERVAGAVPANSAIATLPRLPGPDPAYTIQDSEYDAGSQVVKRIDANGVITTIAYDARGRAIETVEAVGTPVAAATQTLYDAVSNPTRITGRRGQITALAYTLRDLLAERTEAVGTPEAATTRFTYTASGKLATITDALGRTTTNVYGGCCDRLRQVIDALGYITGFSYDFVGNRLTVTDPNGQVTTTAYDQRNRPVAITDPAGGVTRLAYDDDLTDGVGLDAAYPAAVAGLGVGPGCDGSAVAVSDPTGAVRITLRDGLGRTVRTVDPSGAAVTTAYDALVGDGVETSVTDALGRIARARSDGAGLVRWSQDAAGQVTTAAYDANGNRLRVRDALGVGEDATYDALNRLLGRSDTAGSATSTAYDLDGNVVGETDALGQSTSHQYDLRGRRTRSTDRIGAVTSFAYDALNHLITITDAEGGVTSNTYDARGLLVQEVLPGPSGGTRTYTYDAAGRLLTRAQKPTPVATGGN